MSYSIIRVVKVKSKTNTRGIQRHIQRENKNYENIDIDLLCLIQLFELLK
ncbi:plasmid recombination protein [Staphylococcus aureus]|nr:plasmid recombination protein [Staphylococcus aureus]